MRSWRLSLLLFSAVSLLGCLSAEPDAQDDKSIRDFIDLYNQREGVTYLYKCLDPLPPAPLEEDRHPERRAVIIKETECLKSDNPDLSHCDFKPDGEVRVCALVLGDEDPEDIMCIRLAEGARVKRSSRRPCRGRNCRPRPGGFTLIGRPGNNQKRPQLIWV